MIKKYNQFINENNSSLEKDMDYMVNASSDELLDDAIKMGGEFGEELLIKWLNWLQDDRDIYSDFGAGGFDPIFKNIPLLAQRYMIYYQQLPNNNFYKMEHREIVDKTIESLRKISGGL